MRKAVKIASLLVLAVLMVTLASRPVAAYSLRGLKKQLQAVSRKYSYYQAKLHETRKQEKTASQQLAVAERRLSVTRANLRDIRGQLQSTRGKLSKTRSELVVIEARLKKRNELLAARLANSYKHGNVSYASVLVGVTDFYDLLSRGFVVKKVVESDVDLIDSIKEDKKAVEDHKATLEDQKRKREMLENEQEALNRTAQEQTVERGHILQSISQERRKYEQMLDELEKNSQQIEAMIRRMERTPSGHKRLTEVWHGSFLPPVSSYRITDRFGMRYHPITHQYRMHTGVDLACSYGTPIHAAAGGEVIFVGWLGAYGNTVIIDHGGGVTTVYGHQSSTCARTGMAVKQGQVIGYVGSTGWSTGPHVHFEVRRNGRPVSPM